MNKQELVRDFAIKLKKKQDDVRPIIDTFLETVKEALAKGEKEIQILGFGKFVVRERKARTGRNPRTGKPMEIPAREALVFKPGKELKRAVDPERFKDVKKTKKTSKKK